MGAYKSDYVKAKETARNLRNYRWRRQDEQKATLKQMTTNWLFPIYFFLSIGFFKSTMDGAIFFA